jgi:hypothetical protein
VLLIGGRVPVEHALYGGRRDEVFFGDLADTQSALTVLLDGDAIQDKRSSTETLPVQAGAPHAGTHPFDDQRAFKFGDGSDDDDDGPAEWAALVKVSALES